MPDDTHVALAVPATDAPAVDPLLASEGSPDEPPRTRRKPRSRGSRYLRRGLLALAVLMVPVTWSYVGALTGPGTDSLQARTVEWARDHRFGGVVDRIEKYWYAHHQAKVGGAPDSADQHLGVNHAPAAARGPRLEGALPSGDDPAIPTGRSIEPAAPAAPVSLPPSVSTPPVPLPAAPTAAAPAPTPAATGPANPPAPLASPASPPVPGEGQWAGIGPQVGGRYGVYGTLLRPDDVHTSILDAIVYIDPTVVSLRQYPGAKIPGRPWDRPDYVESARQQSLVAAFDGGFRIQDSRGGMLLGGTTLKAMRDGGATLVVDTNGKPDIGMWGRDFTSADGLDSARQNLDLIVDGGVVNPVLATDPNRKWGFTGPANKDAVWRSGLGITADGALLWVGGNGLSIQTLASTLQRAGAVRAMQMDINHDWVQFNTYGVNASGAVHGQLLLPGMRHSGDRYLTEDTRDFVAVFTR